DLSVSNYLRSNRAGAHCRNRRSVTCSKTRAIVEAKSLKMACLVRALHFLDQLRRTLHPLLSFVAKPNAFKHHLPIKTDNPIPRDAIDALAICVRLAKEHGKREFVLFHERFNLANFLVRV